MKESAYLNLVDDILNNGSDKCDRTGVGTISVFGRMLSFDNINEYFPLITTKELNINSIIREMLWFISGKCDNVIGLKKDGVNIWNNWAGENGELGPIYGVQWRKEGQLDNIIQEITDNPNSRRLLVNSWNVDQLHDMALPPCHFAFQFYVDNGKLDLLLYQRSCDLMIGGPYNIAQYAMLLKMISNVCGLTANRLVWSLGDVHIYKNHIDNAKMQIKRRPFEFPNLIVANKDDIDDYKFDDFTLVNYLHHPFIKYEIAV